MGYLCNWSSWTVEDCRSEKKPAFLTALVPLWTSGSMPHDGPGDYTTAALATIPLIGCAEHIVKTPEGVEMQMWSGAGSECGDEDHVEESGVNAIG